MSPNGTKADKEIQNPGRAIGSPSMGPGNWISFEKCLKLGGGMRCIINAGGGGNRIFLSLLQRGGGLEAGLGVGVREFLCRELGVDEAYVSERVTTVFLDAKPVDDLDVAVLREGSVLALSGAMPGLVGAVMRRGSYYAAFRESISHGGLAAGENDGGGKERIRIRLKLFNLVLAELGPGILERGVFVPGSWLLEVLPEVGDEFWRDCGTALWNNNPVEPGVFIETLGQLEGGEVFLQVGISNDKDNG